MGDWLGTGTIATSARTYRPFAEARAWVRALGFQGLKDWQGYCAGRLQGQTPKPADIPSDPARVYKDGGWSGWGDWVGNGSKPRKRKKKPS